MAIIVLFFYIGYTSFIRSFQENQIQLMEVSMDRLTGAWRRLGGLMCTLVIPFAEINGSPSGMDESVVEASDEFDRNVHRLFDEMMELFRTTSVSHPDSGIRATVARFLHKVDTSEWVFGIKLHLSTDPHHPYATARLRTDGRPQITLFPLALLSHFKQAAARYPGQDVGASADELIVIILMHEIHHVERGHVNNDEMDDATRLQYESEAWWYMMAEGMEPSVELKRTRHNIVPAISDGYAAYTLQERCGNCGVWDQFIRHSQLPGQDYSSFMLWVYEELDPYRDSVPL